MLFQNKQFLSKIQDNFSSNNVTIYSLRLSLDFDKNSGGTGSLGFEPKKKTVICRSFFFPFCYGLLVRITKTITKVSVSSPYLYVTF